MAPVGDVPNQKSGCCATNNGDDPADLDDRACTDFGCLLLFAFYWLLLVGIALAAVSTGDLKAIWFGRDYMGNRCGTDAFEAKPKLWFPRISQDIGVQMDKAVSHRWADIQLYGLCVDACPKYGAATGPLPDYGWGTDGALEGKTQPEWDVHISTVDTFNRCLPRMETNTSLTRLCAEPTCVQAGMPCFSGLPLAPHGAWEVTTRAEMTRCDREVDIFMTRSAKQANAGFVLTYLLEVLSRAESAYDAIVNRKQTIATFGIGLPMLLSFAWLVFLFFFAGWAVYLALFLLVIVEAAATFLCAHKAGMTGDIVDVFLNSTLANSAQEAIGTYTQGMQDVAGHPMVQSALEVEATREMQDIYKYSAIVGGIVLLLLIIAIAASRRQIQRTSTLVKEGTLVVQNSPTMVIFPLVIYVGQLLLAAFCAIVVAFLWTNPGKSYASIMEHTTSVMEAVNASDTSFLADVDEKQLLYWETGLVGFGFLWTYLFFVAIETTVISGCVVYYYFIDQDTAGRRDERYADNQTDFIVVSMFWQVLKCNLGTMAFGSLLLALVEAVRIFLEYVSEQTKATQQQNALLALVLKCCKCFLFCFEKSIKFATTYAYTYVIMENRSFCSACFSSYRLLANYAQQILINRIVQVVLYWVQTLSVPLISALLGYRVMLDEDEDISIGSASTWDYVGPLMPAGAIFVLAFIMARTFAHVYEQVITALTVCVLNDITHYDPPYITKRMYNAFELEPPWGEREASTATRGTLKEDAPAKKRPLAGRKLVGGKSKTAGGYEQMA